MQRMRNFARIFVFEMNAIFYWWKLCINGFQPFPPTSSTFCVFLLHTRRLSSGPVRSPSHNKCPCWCGPGWFAWRTLCPLDFCKGRETLQNLCDQIPGDALLYSLFRESAEPVKCPLKGTAFPHRFASSVKNYFYKYFTCRTFHLYVQPRQWRMQEPSVEYWELHGGQSSAA